MSKLKIVSQINKAVEHATWNEMIMKRNLHRRPSKDEQLYRLRAIVYIASDVVLADAIDKLIEKMK